MTEFEVERIKQALAILKEQKLKTYEDQVGRCDNPKQLTREVKKYTSAINDVETLLKNYGLLTAGISQTAEQLNNPEKEHMYRFGVKYKAYAPEEYADWSYNEVRTQTGCTENEAKEYLESHLQFEYCNDKTFRDLKIELIDQYY